MNRDAFDVYKVTIDDTNHLNLRRQAMDSFYVALVTFVLSGDGYVAYNSTFASWLAAVLTEEGHKAPRLEPGDAWPIPLAGIERLY